MRLLRFQRKLDDEKGAGLLGLSLQVHKGAGLRQVTLTQVWFQSWWLVFYVLVQATMEALLALGLHKQAEQLYRDFRVPDKRLDIQEVMSHCCIEFTCKV